MVISLSSNVCALVALRLVSTSASLLAMAPLKLGRALIGLLSVLHYASDLRDGMAELLFDLHTMYACQRRLAMALARGVRLGQHFVASCVLHATCLAHLFAVVVVVEIAPTVPAIPFVKVTCVYRYKRSKARESTPHLSYLARPGRRYHIIDALREYGSDFRAGLTFEALRRHTSGKVLEIPSHSLHPI